MECKTTMMRELKMMQPAEKEKLNNLKNILRNTDHEIFQDEILMKDAKTGAGHYQIDISHCTPTFIFKVNQIYLAVIIQGSKKLDFKKLKKYLGTNKIRMATPEEIIEITGASVGSVSMINA